MSVEFDTPANRIIAQQAPKNQFGIDTSLPDIAFLRQLTVQGRMRYTSGSISGLGVVTSFTPSNGETFFLLHAQFTCTSGVAVSVRLDNDDQARSSLSTLFGAVTTFDVGIDSLVGDGTKSISLNNLSATIAFGNLIGWVENTSRIRDVTN